MSASILRSPSPDQIAYVAGLQSRLRLPDGVLDQHCRKEFNKPFAELDRRDVSKLLEQLTQWEALPAELMRAKGQLDLFGDLS